ncbi:MAG: HAMP domain-containing sensor histidine kinase [Bacillota bacterium]
MKYWHKIFLATLAAFLIAFNLGAFLLADASYRSSLAAERERAFAEHAFIANAMERDLAATSQRVDSTENRNLIALYKSYAEYYYKQGLFLGLRDPDGGAYSNLPILPPAPDDLSSAAQLARVQNVEGEPYLVVEGAVAGTGYSLITARSLKGLKSRTDTLTLTLAGESLALSLLLCGALIAILKFLTLPIKKLTDAAAGIAAGRYCVRADVLGKDELAELAMSFNRMADEIQAQIDALSLAAQQKQRFIDDLAHEMRTPLTAIGGYSQYLAAAVTTEEERLSALEYIQRESMRLAELSDKLLLLVKLRNGTPEREPVPLGALIGDAMATIAHEVGERCVKVHSEYTDDVVLSDETLLNVLIVNLVRNAIHAAGTSGNVWIRATASAIIIKDDGCGIKPEDITHITEPFFRISKSRSRDDGGAGLGLSICARIAEMLDLSLSFDSSVGQGTTVTVKFLQDDNDSIETPSQTPAKMNSNIERGRGWING